MIFGTGFLTGTPVGFAAFDAASDASMRASAIVLRRQSGAAR